MQSPTIADITCEAREAVNIAILKLVLAAAELGVTFQEVQAMLELGMSPVEVLDYLDAKLRRRIQ